MNQVNWPFRGHCFVACGGIRFDSYHQITSPSADCSNRVRCGPTAKSGSPAGSRPDHSTWRRTGDVPLPHPCLPARDLTRVTPQPGIGADRGTRGWPATVRKVAMPDTGTHREGASTPIPVPWSRLGMLREVSGAFPISCLAARRSPVAVGWHPGRYFDRPAIHNAKSIVETDFRDFISKTLDSKSFLRHL
ncbi:MAG: hypothetical protein JWM11_1790 [Planctomycetaceae bacterium]|nr:hypothetical protein [Planctomycetaceae bacterium]